MRMPSNNPLGDRNPCANWKGAHARLRPETWPRSKSTFTIAPGQRIFTVGSCFARNIERKLRELGFVVPALDLTRCRSTSGQEIINKYTPATICQEIRWAGDIRRAGDVVKWEHIEALLFPTEDGTFIDMQLSEFNALDRRRTLEQRQAIFDLYRNIFDSDVVVITLGLIESWMDTHTGLHIQKAPAAREMNKSSHRFHFEVLDYNAVLRYLRETIDIVRSNCSAKFLITTSPVPMNRTFRDVDVILANSESKAVLRAATAAVASEGTDVDYFPSFEMVTMTEGWEAYEADLIHVKPVFVSKIVTRMLQSYLQVGDEQSTLKRFSTAADEGRTDEAIGIIQSYVLDHPEASISEPLLLSLFQIAEKSGSRDICADIHSRLRKSQGFSADLTSRLIDVLLRTQDLPAALAVVEDVRGIHFQDSRLSFLIGKTLFLNDRVEEAIASYTEALDIRDISGIRLELARAYLHNGQQKVAMECLTPLLESMLSAQEVQLASYICEICGERQMAYRVNMNYLRSLCNDSAIWTNVERLVPSEPRAGAEQLRP